MRVCWLKWVGRDWSISADYIWLNYSDANNRELAKIGVTLKLLHAEYVDRCTEAGAPSMSYDRLCKRSITRLRVDRGEANILQRRG